MKIVGIRLILTTFLMIVLEMLVLNIAGILPFVAEHKKNISGAPYLEFVMNNLFHPIDTISKMIQEKNPLFLLGSGGVVLLSFYGTFFMKRAKGKYQLADRYGVHGSSRFAHKHEIFRQGETVGIPLQQLMKDLESSMDHAKKEI